MSTRLGADPARSRASERAGANWAVDSTSQPKRRSARHREAKPPPHERARAAHNPFQDNAAVSALMRPPPAKATAVRGQRRPTTPARRTPAKALRHPTLSPRTAAAVAAAQRRVAARAAAERGAARAARAPVRQRMARTAPALAGTAAASAARASAAPGAPDVARLQHRLEPGANAHPKAARPGRTGSAAREARLRSVACQTAESSLADNGSPPPQPRSPSRCPRPEADPPFAGHSPAPACGRGCPGAGGGQGEAAAVSAGSAARGDAAEGDAAGGDAASAAGGSSSAHGSCEAIEVRPSRPPRELLRPAEAPLRQLLQEPFRPRVSPEERGGSVSTAAPGSAGPGRWRLPAGLSSSLCNLPAGDRARSPEMSRRLGLSDSLSDLSEGLPSLRQPGARCDLASSAPSSVESCAELEARDVPRLDREYPDTTRRAAGGAAVLSREQVPHDTRPPHRHVRDTSATRPSATRPRHVRDRPLPVAGAARQAAQVARRQRAARPILARERRRVDNLGLLRPFMTAGRASLRTSMQALNCSGALPHASLFVRPSSPHSSRWGRSYRFQCGDE